MSKRTVLELNLFDLGSEICRLQACVRTFQPGNLWAGALKGLTNSGVCVNCPPIYYMHHEVCCERPQGLLFYFYM